MLTTLQKALQAEKNNPTIFDIILYGSAVKGKSKPRDIDIVVIFRYGTVRERLAIIQNLKQKIRVSLEVDIKGILWEELFKPDFFARTGIFLEGISLLDGKPVAQKLGFQAGVVLFVFNLKSFFFSIISLGVFHLNFFLGLLLYFSTINLIKWCEYLDISLFLGMYLLINLLAFSIPGFCQEA
jgi:predicted nucleotidyltransferase